MVLGYNQPRPSIENYQDFMNKLVKGLVSLGNDGLSLMIYGSYVRGDMDIGRSDVDGAITFPHDVVIPKDFFGEVSKVFYDALRENTPMREILQISPLDVGIMRDGRFNSFTEEFRDYFNTEGEIYHGPDYRREMVYLAAKGGEESAISHNLRKTRQSLLFSEYDRWEDYESFLKGFDKTLNAASRGSKQILGLIDGKLRKNRFSALKELSSFFPELNVEPLEQIRDLYHHPEKLDMLYRNADETKKVWNSALTFFEEVVREFIKKYPYQEAL